MSAKPVVYFIDDSATVREVIKIAFRREELEVIACPDADSALDRMEQTPPDVVITDLIMPGRDGYDVCRHVKQHPRYGETPVILMSGVVNQAVAERAFSVQADELMRKPFQPRDLIARVRHLLAGPQPEQQPAANACPAGNACEVLSSIFNGPAPVRKTHGQPPRLALVPMPARVPPPPGSGGEATRLRLEVLRLQSRVKKLEQELTAEREYSKALVQRVTSLRKGELREGV